ncbi:MAG TPA: cbb3-type cytochrome c oxidase subunit I [Cyclobacteriaceae bacterium]|nr:cbb3-type cytochrome c oxidase subunit I [Cyclobacteriaceae bacterium]HMV10555.1 cbb3-type cytochrome c oxidase subunit I [Cyclobacteriaceae bacterium]HMV88527.1 cbb3-type cytochrome c oxidase subunit I [Cyclobacteriaceae bacterium]HMW99433.1 cbb3-type cytochrome c oxidase subunit I [Cyclobacteriaceae bacterium]HMX48778.1 cbb3-type cytochrome c oxidase subunit I [Cyclobacteriaceae bacterium]
MEPKKGFIHFLMNPEKWWIPLTFIFVVSFTGVGIIGYETYYEAPPIPTFISESGENIFTADDILDGQATFQRLALMDFGSMFGDGANRGPDFTAQSLHQVTVYIEEYYQNQPDLSKLAFLGVKEQVKRELKENRYEKSSNAVKLTPAQEYACNRLVEFYREYFKGASGQKSLKNGYISGDGSIEKLTAFFYWGAWVCSVKRPGESYSYTHNWPYDPDAGNLPETPVIIWTIIGSLGLVLALGIVLFYHGRLEKLSDRTFLDNSRPLMTLKGVNKFNPTAAQKATFKFFYAAIFVLLFQVLAGILTVHDFVNFTVFFGYDLRDLFPITITRGWHVQLSLLWISACWIGASLFVTPFITKEPSGYRMYINILFWLVFTLVAGSIVGIYIGPMGLTDYWYWLGNQGWEYVEPGKIWQGLLFVIFALWAVTLYKALRPAISLRQPWELPNWLVYATFSILILLISGFIATPKTNFVIADFWRWCVIHMWAEAFFEVFTTVLVGYFMILMGLVSKESAVRVIYLATLLFLGSGLLGISHNFYWNAKPVATMALGSVFSTLQVVPLILLTLEAWRFQKLPKLATKNMSNGNGDHKGIQFGMSDVFLFLVGVNFWNFFGAGVMGFIINLPLTNYYEHGTYLTVNHGHAALMGVYGNLSIAGVLFCSKLLTENVGWRPALTKLSFWSINVGLMLMILLDLFPAGVLQFMAVVEHGMWYARSNEFIEQNSFQTLTWLRIVGGTIFTIGGVFPLVLIIIKSSRNLKPISANLVATEKDLEVTAQV